MRVQLCGQLVVRRGDDRLEGRLPSRQGRLAFVFLVLRRHDLVGRDALAEALWPVDRPALVDTALSALLSKLRKALGQDVLDGRNEIRLTLPGAWIDIEAALEAIHRAEAAAARKAWADVWGPSRVALHVVRRPFLPGEDAPWIDEQRRLLEDVELRALECIGESSLGLGGVELDSALRSGRDLVRLAPYRESGHRLLMRALAAEDNMAEALVVYEQLRLRLREALGASPSPATKALHGRLLRGETSS